MTSSPTTIDLALEALSDGEEIERYKLHAKIGYLAKGKYQRRNAPQYRHVEDALKKLLSDGRIEKRYAPFYLKPDDPKLGKDFYKLLPDREAN